MDSENSGSFGTTMLVGPTGYAGGTPYPVYTNGGNGGFGNGGDGW